VTVDYHIHSKFSSDGRSSLREICQIALSLGIREIGFAEHVDFDPADPGFGYFDYGAYSLAVDEARDLFGKRITILKGVEVDYQRRFEGAIRRWLKMVDVDFTIGSVHYVEGRPIDLGGANIPDLGRLYLTYCIEVVNSVKSGLFDVIGHFDIISSFNHIPPNVKDEPISIVLESIVDSNASMEINARGFREGRGDTVPTKEIVRRFLEQGGKKVSVGSDAHSAQEVGVGIDETFAMLRKLDRKKQLVLFQAK